MVGKDVPDRWEQYSNIGKVVQGTRFIAFKVPLKQSLLKKLPPDVDPKWSVQDLAETEKNLGLVIDLTFTSRYYDFKDVEQAGIKYAKIGTMGRIIPRRSVIKAFNAAVDDFLSKEEEKLIGVHCTHGLNRTGYLICRYMIERMGLEPEKAIQLFNEARGHNQERENLIQHLREKAWETEPEQPEEPAESVPENGGSSKRKKKSRWGPETPASSNPGGQTRNHDNSNAAIDNSGAGYQNGYGHHQSSQAAGYESYASYGGYGDNQQQHHGQQHGGRGGNGQGRGGFGSGVSRRAGYQGGGRGGYGGGYEINGYDGNRGGYRGNRGGRGRGSDRGGGYGGNRGGYVNQQGGGYGGGPDGGDRGGYGGHRGGYGGGNRGGHDVGRGGYGGGRGGYGGGHNDGRGGGSGGPQYSRGRGRGNNSSSPYDHQQGRGGRGGGGGRGWDQGRGGGGRARGNNSFNSRGNQFDGGPRDKNVANYFILQDSPSLLHGLHSHHKPGRNLGHRKSHNNHSGSKKRRRDMTDDGPSAKKWKGKAGTFTSTDNFGIGTGNSATSNDHKQKPASSRDGFRIPLKKYLSK